LDQQLAQATSGLRLKLECFLNLRVGDETTQDEHVTELATGRAGRHTRDFGFVRADYEYRSAGCPHLLTGGLLST